MHRCAAVTVAIALLSCRSATQITVEVTTDVPCSDGPSTSIAVGTLGSDVEDKPPVVETTRCTNGRIGSLVVVPSGGKDDEVAIRVVTGVGKQLEACRRDGFKGCIVARRALRFQPHEELHLPITMTRDCVDLPCGASQTCSHGACVAARLPDPETCTTPGGCGATDAGVDAPVADSGPDALSPPGTWRRIASSKSAGIAGRTEPSVLWTGSKMVMWGGDVTGAELGDGGVYDPATDSWMPIPAAPSGKSTAVPIVFGGSELLVFRGVVRAEVMAYDLAKRTWRIVPPVPSTFGYDVVRQYVTIWSTTTNEWLIWGGVDAADKPTNVGVAYAPSTNSWRKLAASTLPETTWGSAAWDGTRMIVFGGRRTGAFSNQAAAYDPKTDAWTVAYTAPIAGRMDDIGISAGPTKTSVTFFGGGDPFTEERADGVFLDGANFSAIPDVDALPSPHRTLKVAWFGAGRLFTWGGLSTDKVAHDDGASFDPKSGVWTPMPKSPLAARWAHGAIWTGASAIVWGGCDASEATVYDDGAIFTP